MPSLIDRNQINVETGLNSPPAAASSPAIQPRIMPHNTSRRSIAMNENNQRISSLPQSTADIAAVILRPLILIATRPAPNVDIQPIARERKQVQHGQRGSRSQINLPSEDAMKVRRRSLVLPIRRRGHPGRVASSFNRHRYRVGRPDQPGHCQRRWRLRPSKSSRPRHHRRHRHRSAANQKLSPSQGHALFTSKKNTISCPSGQLTVSLEMQIRPRRQIRIGIRM